MSSKKIFSKRRNFLQRTFRPLPGSAIGWTRRPEYSQDGSKSKKVPLCPRIVPLVERPQCPVSLPDMENAISCRGLRKTYDGKVEAVRGLDLAIQAGECFGLLGPNGAGKTTTIEILAGLPETSSGALHIAGMT